MRALISIPKDGQNTASKYFARACFAQVQARMLDQPVEKFIPANDDVTGKIIQRSDAVVGTTTGSGWTAIAQSALRSFLSDLEGYSGAARLIAQAVPAKIRVAREEYYPVRAAGAQLMAFVGEAEPIPVGAGNFSLITIGPIKKMAHIIAWSRELAKRTDAETIFNQMLREDVGASIDAAFFATTVGSATAPAGLLYGVTPSSGYGGGDTQAIKNDFLTLSDAVATNGSGDVTFIMAPERLMRLRIQAPELADTLDIVASAAVPLSRVVAVDARSLLVSIDPTPDMFLSKYALLHMSDTPAEIVTGAGTIADPTRSLWQTASEALRVIHEIDFVKRRTGAVAYLENPTW